ncbi:MAG: hypothetical protein WKF89_17080, partial [Chitinophagaceae bacterium]
RFYFHYQKNRKNMIRLISITVIFFLIYLVAWLTLSDYRNLFPSFSTLFTWFLVGVIVYAFYLILKRSKNSITPARGKSWLYGILGGATIVYLFKRFFGIVSVKFFLFSDNLLRISEEIPPPVMWALLGSFIGLTAGCFIAWKKYKLDFKVNFIPIGIILVFLALLVAFNNPFETIASATERKNEYAYAYVSINVSSSLPEFRNNTYSAANLVDLNDNTAWIDDGKRAGIGEQVDFTFERDKITSLQNISCIGFKIKNGYNKSQKTWEDNNRVRLLNVYHNNKMVERITASDLYKKWEEIAIMPISVRPGDVISVHISSFYAGNKMPAQTAITELVPRIEYER